MTPPRARATSLAGACLLACALAAWPAALASADEVTARRFSVHVRERKFLPIADLESYVAVDQSLASIAAVPGGLVISGVRAGDTVMQVYAGGGMQVVIIDVLGYVPPPPVNNAPINPDEHGPIDTFFGVNSVSSQLYIDSQLGWYLDQSIAMAGKFRKGDYHAVAEMTFGDLGTRFLHGLIDWTSEKHDWTLELGDVAETSLASQLLLALPMRGLHVHKEIDGFSADVYAGTLLGLGNPFGTSFNQPSLGATVWKRLGLGRGWIARVGASVLAFATADTQYDAGRTGVIGAVAARLDHPRGYGVELHVGGEMTQVRNGSGPSRAAPTLGWSAWYNRPRYSYRLEYEGNGSHLYLPTASFEQPATQRVSASMSRTSTRGYGGGAGIGFVWITDPQGRTVDGLTFNGSFSARLNRRVRLVLDGGQISTVTPSAVPLPAMPGAVVGVTGSTSPPPPSGPLVVPAPAPTGGIIEREQRRAQAATYIQMTKETQGQVQLAFLQDVSGQNQTSSLWLTTAVQRVHAPRWDIGGTLAVGGMEQSVLAVDQPPLTIDAVAGVNGRFIMRNLQTFGGFSLQTQFADKVDVGAAVYTGLQYSPTSAHRFTATINVAMPLGSHMVTENAMIGYTYRFGDAVHAPPLFDFLSWGRIEGRVCLDTDGDGQCGPGETPLPGVVVRLSNDRTARSGSDGWYTFAHLTPGSYHVSIDEATLRDRGRMTTGGDVTVELKSRRGERADFGVTVGCELRGRVIHDLDLDRRAEEGEPMVAGTTIHLVGRDGSVDVQASNVGVFHVNVPVCGDYFARIDTGTLPSSMVAESEDVPVHLDPREVATVTLYVAAIRTVEGRVFVDANRNGRHDPGERTLGGVRVRWAGGSGTSDGDGQFLLRHLPAGRVELAVDPASLPRGYEPANGVRLDLPREPASVEQQWLPVVPTP